MKDEPVAYSMAVGELAAPYNDERKIRAKIEVVPVLGWHRVLRYDPTSLPWLNPSPDIRNIRQAILYPRAGR